MTVPMGFAGQRVGVQDSAPPKPDSNEREVYFRQLDETWLHTGLEDGCRQ